MTSRAQPIDPRQFIWWHRLRRLGCWGFTLGLGAVAAPALTVALFIAVALVQQRVSINILSGASLIWLICTPFFTGASLWTYWHMEGRYRSTLNRHCPGCGYLLLGRTEATGACCPECGLSLASADA